MGISSSFYVWQNSPVKPSGPGFLFIGSIFMTFIFISSDRLFSWSVSYSVLACCKFLESCLFLLGCQICWHTIVHSILLWFLYFCNICCDFSFFTILFIWVFSSPLLGESGQRFVNFAYFFKEPALGQGLFDVFGEFHILVNLGTLKTGEQAVSCPTGRFPAR